MKRPRSGPSRRVRLFVRGLLAFGTFMPVATLSDQDTEGSRWWWNVSASVQGTRLTCDLCSTDRDFGPALGIGVVTLATPAVRVGLHATEGTTSRCRVWPVSGSIWRSTASADS